MDPENLYGKVFYESLAEGTKRSAVIVVPVLVDLLKPRSVVDVGCGDGAWLRAFGDHGIGELVGVDGPWAEAHWRPQPGATFLARDLTKPLGFERRFDLAVCLEVAEHLPRDQAGPLVAELTRLSSIIVFSAAIPCQGGDGHLNEQWTSYWSALFAERGFECAANLRWRFWTDERVMFWYRQNLLCFVARAETELVQRLRQAESAWLAEAKDVVHPELFLRYCRDLEQEAARAGRATDALSLRDSEVARATQDLSQARAALAELQTSLANAHQELGVVGRGASEARDELRQTKHELENVRRALGETGRELENVRRALGETEHELENVRRALGETEHELENVRRALGESGHELEKVRTDLYAAREELIVERDRVGKLDKDLSEIKDSRSWRFVQRMWQVRRVLRLP